MIPEHVDAVGVESLLSEIVPVKVIPADFFRSIRLTASTLPYGRLCGFVECFEARGMGMSWPTRAHPCLWDRLLMPVRPCVTPGRPGAIIGK